eukprot:scaffold3080_cov38-Tisochrysis_lutea.AAC.8
MDWSEGASGCCSRNMQALKCATVAMPLSNPSVVGKEGSRQSNTGVQPNVEHSEGRTSPQQVRMYKLACIDPQPENPHSRAHKAASNMHDLCQHEPQRMADTDPGPSLLAQTHT